MHCCSACCHGDVGICQLLVNNGAPVTIDNTSGLSPLHVACLYGHSDCVAALLTVMCVSGDIVCLVVHVALILIHPVTSTSSVHSLHFSLSSDLNQTSSNAVSISAIHRHTGKY